MISPIAGIAEEAPALKLPLSPRHYTGRKVRQDNEGQR
ncbi:hypothetical protein HNQ71_004964 [Mesorhizobium sangaii]|uniref:Uncharacterized protein n=1 Tax=Mesorhizobium sangaii TaxID=505389 RepID=A0A841PAF9_9HYPH|nr:hypothetical protein [Mesorhizobium sangaii]